MSSKESSRGHPGPYIKSNVIPHGMNVTQAAKNRRCRTPRIVKPAERELEPIK